MAIAPASAPRLKASLQRIPWWCWGALLAAMAIVVEGQFFLHHRPGPYASGQGWKALSLFIPACAEFFFITVGFWMHAKRAKSASRRYFRWALFATVIGAEGSIFLAIAWLVIRA